MAQNRTAALSLSYCKKMKDLQRQFEHFLIFMTNQESNTSTKVIPYRTKKAG